MTSLREMIKRPEIDNELLAVLADVVEHLCDIAKSLPTQDVSQSTAFFSPIIPEISVNEYLERIKQFAGCSPECFVIALIYIDRIIELNPNFHLSPCNIHRLLITSVMSAAKFWDDECYNNAYYARIGGVSTREMNELEVEFLYLIDFNLHVQPDSFEHYFGALQSTRLQHQKNPNHIQIQIHHQQQQLLQKHHEGQQPQPQEQPQEVEVEREQLQAQAQAPAQQQEAEREEQQKADEHRFQGEHDASVMRDQRPKRKNTRRQRRKRPSRQRRYSTATSRSMSLPDQPQRQKQKRATNDDGDDDEEEDRRTAPSEMEFAKPQSQQPSKRASPSSLPRTERERNANAESVHSAAPIHVPVHSQTHVSPSQQPLSEREREKEQSREAAQPPSKRGSPSFVYAEQVAYVEQETGRVSAVSFPTAASTSANHDELMFIDGDCAQAEEEQEEIVDALLMRFARGSHHAAAAAADDSSCYYSAADSSSSGQYQEEEEEGGHDHVDAGLSYARRSLAPTRKYSAQDYRDTVFPFDDLHRSDQIDILGHDGSFEDDDEGEAGDYDDDEEDDDDDDLDDDEDDEEEDDEDMEDADMENGASFCGFASELRYRPNCLLPTSVVISPVVIPRPRGGSCAFPMRNSVEQQISFSNA